MIGTEISVIGVRIATVLGALAHELGVHGARTKRVHPHRQWRQLDGKFQIWPAVTTNEYLGLEYISKNWARTAAGVGTYTLTANTDTTIFPDQLMIVGLKMKYFSVKGFDATEFRAEFGRLVNIAKASEVAGRTLSFAPTVSNVLITPQNIPDSGFGQPFQ